MGHPVYRSKGKCVVEAVRPESGSSTRGGGGGGEEGGGGGGEEEEEEGEEEEEDYDNNDDGDVDSLQLEALVLCAVH